MDDEKKCDEAFKKFYENFDFEKLRYEVLFEADYGKDFYIHNENRNEVFRRNIQGVLLIAAIHLHSKNKGSDEWKNFLTLIKNCLYLAFQSFSRIGIKYFKATDKVSIDLISNTMSFEGNELQAFAKVCNLSNRIDILSLCTENFEYEITIEYYFKEAESD